MRDSRRTRVVLAVLLLSALTLVVLSLRGGTDGLRNTAASIFGPVENAAGAVVRPVRDFFTSFGNNDDKVAELQAQVDELTKKLDTLDYDRARAEELERLYSLSQRGRYTVVAAQVVAFSSTQTQGATVTIDAGSASGLKVNQTVVNGQGLVGRVASTTPHSAVVELLTGDGTTFGARVGPQLKVGILKGTGSPTSMSLAVTDPLATLKVGDRLVTTYNLGLAGAAPGVPIGVVTALGGNASSGFKQATVAPYVDVTSLDLVGVVVVPPDSDPRDSVLPPAPSPSSAASASPSGSASGSPSGAPSGSAR